MAALTALLVAGSARAAKPSFDHTAPQEATIGQDLAINAVIKSAGGIFDPYVWYRAVGAKAFKKVSLKPGANGEFSATIPGSEITGDLEYYLQAFDAGELTESTWASKKVPYRLKSRAAPAAAKLGTLTVRSDPDGGTVDIDGQRVGVSPWAGPVGAGNHVMTVTLNGYEPLRMNFTMAPGVDISLPAPLRRAGGESVQQQAAQASGPGKISVDTRPMGARLLIDDQGQGRAPNLITMSPGPHKVVAVLDGFSPATQLVDLGPGRTETVRLTLQSADLNDARSRLEKAHKSAPKDADVSLNLAQVCEALREYPCAVEGYESYLSNAPGGTYAAEVQGRLSGVRAAIEAKARENQFIDFTTDQTGESFGVEVRTADQILRCDGPVTFGRTCRLSVPPGRAQIVVSGAANMTRDLNVQKGRTEILVQRGASAAPVVWGILFMGGAVGGYVAIKNQAEGKNPPESAPDWLLPAAGGVGALGFIMFIYGVANNDSMDIKSYGEGTPNLPRGPAKKSQLVGLGVMPTPGGFTGGATLRF